ncbi:MAG: hypothetical protein AAFY15_13075, partial [Cyanobacteria bacterium J06648_11]
GAFFAIAEVYNVLNSEATQNARAIRASADAFLEQRDAADDSMESLSGFSEAFSRITSAADAGGAVDGIRASLIELDRAFGGVSDSTTRFGSQFGIITEAQRKAQTDILAVTDVIGRFEARIGSASDFLAKWGQAFKDSTRELSSAELEAFTEASKEEIAVRQELIELLDSYKGASQEVDALLNAEIATREREIAQIIDRAEAQGASTAALEAEARAIKGVADALDEITAKYERAGAVADLDLDRRLADIENAQASGALSAANAERAKAEAQQQAALNAVDSTKAQLQELQALREAAIGRGDTDEIDKLDDQIIEAEAAITQATRDAAQARIKENERAAKESVDAEKKAQRERLDAVRAANAAILAEIDQDRDDEVIQVREAQLAGELDPDEAAARIVDAQLEAS